MSLFGSPGRPKRSIVANFAPKMTPKWSPKWSHSDNGRPLRNMHRHSRIAYPPLFSRLQFRSKKSTVNILPTINIQFVFYNILQTNTKKCPSGDPDLTGIGYLFCSGGPFEPPRPPPGPPTSPPGPPWGPPKVTQNEPRFTENHKTELDKCKNDNRVQRPCFARNVQTNAGISPVSRI